MKGDQCSIAGVRPRLDFFSSNSSPRSFKTPACQGGAQPIDDQYLDSLKGIKKAGSLSLGCPLHILL